MNEFANFVRERRIQRLCHFTKVKNLPYILRSGILSSNQLSDVNKNDLGRYDKHEGHVCLSIQFPNVFYLETICSCQNIPKNAFCILEISTRIIDENTLFSKVNAATECGAYIKNGIDAFREMYDDEVVSSKRKIRRCRNWISSVPTDIQAEVLIPERVPPEYITGIIFFSKYEALRQKNILNLNNIRVSYSEYIFNSERTKSYLDIGKYPYCFKL